MGRVVDEQSCWGSTVVLRSLGSDDDRPATPGEDKRPGGECRDKKFRLMLSWPTLLSGHTRYSAECHRLG